MAALVAPSYKNLKQLTDVIMLNGKSYVKVETANGAAKLVRAYSEQEYSRLYPEVKIIKPARSMRYPLGFGDAGYIWLFKGENTYELLDWFHTSPCRYARPWGWYLPSDIEMPNPLPAGLEPVKLLWTEVSFNDKLISEKDLQIVAESKLYEPTPSKWIGKIGERLNLILTCTNVYDTDNTNYGVTHLNRFIDKNENIFIWSTTAKRLEPGHTYELTGSIKSHDMYRNSCQTTLSNCRIKGEIE